MSRNAIIAGTKVKYIEGSVFITPTFGVEKKIGYIKDGKLIVTDLDNYHHKSKSLGIDRAIVEGKLLNFTQVHFTFHGHLYASTRRFFADKGRKRSLMNGREMIFLTLRQLNLGLGLAYDKMLADKAIKKWEYPSDLAKWDIFDVFLAQIKRGISNNRLFHKWEKLINGNQVDNGRSSTKSSDLSNGSR